jgi:hypothetical protein
VQLQWRQAYAAAAAQAMELGIPRAAIPPLEPEGGGGEAALTAADVARAREHLQGMVASFLSAGL